MRLVNAVLYVAPAGVLMYWGGVYLLSYVHLLEAPGVPVAFRYKAKAGDVTITADSYSVDTHAGTIRVLNPRVVAPGGTVLAQLAYLEVRGIDIRKGADQTLRLFGSSLDAKLVRLHTGRFEIQDLLPPSTATKSTTAFEVELDRCRILLIDRAGPTEWRQPITSPRVRVSGVGSDWVAMASGSVPGTGQVNARVENLRDLGLKVQLSPSDLEVAPILRHLAQTPQARAVGSVAEAEAGSVRVLGPVSLFLPSQGEVRFVSDLHVVVKNARWHGYSVESATFKGKVTSFGFGGQVDVVSPGLTASFDGSGILRGKVGAAGQVNVFASNASALPLDLRRLIPSAARFDNLRYTGWASFTAPRTGSIDGTVSASEAAYGRDRIEHPELAINGGMERINARLLSGSVDNISAEAVASFEPRSKAIQGFVRTGRFDLTTLGKRFGRTEFLGVAEVEASVEGTLKNPRLAWDVKGGARYRPDAAHEYPIGDFSASGTYANQIVQVQRGVVNGPSGLVAMSGHLLPDGTLSMDVRGRRLNAYAYDKRIGGTANLVATVKGNLKNPSAAGRAEFYGISYDNRSVPAATLDFLASKRSLIASKLEAIMGTASLTGSGAYGFSDHSIQANLKASRIQIADLLDKQIADEFAGEIDMPSLVASGTLQDPHVAALVKGTHLVARGIAIDSIDAPATLNGSQIVLSNAKVVGAGGSITANASYDTKTRDGTAKVAASDLSLAKLAPETSEYAAIDGTISGSATVRVLDNKIFQGEASGDIANVQVNGTQLGSGPWTAYAKGKDITAGLQVGTLDDYVDVQNATYDLDSHKLSAHVDALKIPIANIIETTLRYFPNLSVDVEQALRDTRGALTFSADFSQQGQELSVDLKKLNATTLSFRGQNFGQITATAKVQNHRLSLEALNLEGPVATANVSGVVDTDGDLSLTGDVKVPHISAFSVLAGGLAGQGGSFNASFLAEGKTSSPVIRASADAEDLLEPPSLPGPTTAPNSNESLRVLLDTIHISESKPGVDLTARGGIEVSGSYFYKGFTGQISASLPLQYPFVIPKEEPVEGSVTIRERTLQEIAPLLSGLDPKKTAGTVSGSASASGTINDIKLGGKMHLAASSLGFLLPSSQGLNELDDTLKSVDATAELRASQLSLSATALSSAGGQLSATASTSLNNLVQAVRGGTRSFDPSALPISGRIEFKDLKGRQGFAGKAYVAATVNGAIDIDGTFRRPSVTGDLSISGLDTVMPTFQPQTPGSDTPGVNPIFNLTANLASGSHVRSSAADMYIDGQGKLTGSLSRPVAEADFGVEKGTVKLPTSTVRIVPGGTVHLDYRSQASQTLATLDVNLEGKTSVTTTLYGQNFQRFDISLGIQGDLLKEGGLKLSASSDPPGLSQDRILALLGQTDVFTSIGSESGSETEARLRNALAGYALPTVFDPITSGIGRGLGLEYFSLEYNPYEQAVIAFARSLNAEFTIQGTRQISQPPPGFPTQYDIQLVYSPRRVRGILRSFSFSVGADQDRPWKLATTYGTRF